MHSFAARFYFNLQKKFPILYWYERLKNGVAKMIHPLPEDATREDIQYHLYVPEKIRKDQEFKKP
ncbi:MAG: hypothetical protein CV082_05040 [Candidatus Brocadia sp. BL1]|nr:MAG: hypothetical protein CV082_05040 [Candidatus Brocadia sp. BL1]